MTLVSDICDAIIESGLVNEREFLTLADIVSRCLPQIPEDNKKKIHWQDPRANDAEPVCGTGRKKNPVVTLDKDFVTCRNCRMMYLFDEKEQ